jgi:hypothetical protein
MTKHTPATPLPWATRKPAKANIYTLTDNTAAIAMATHHHGTQKQFENAAYIAHACNSYPRLVEALREHIAYLGKDVPSYDCGKRRSYDAARALLRELGEE